MRVLSIDGEWSTFQRGNPFSRRNKLACFGAYDGTDFTYYDIEHSGLPYGETLCKLKRHIESAEMIIGFNFKGDGCWLRRYVPGLVFGRLWDCQLAEFILNDQTTPYPSLAGCLERYGLPPKRDVVKSDYWDRGLDTDAVPEEILREYNERDCVATYEVYQHQKKLLTGNKLRLFQLHCADLLVLMEMEYNGLLFNAQKSRELGIEIEKELKGVVDQLNDLVKSDGQINWNSPTQVSAVLYGGIVKFPARIATERLLKDGSIKHGEKNGHREQSFVRLVDPLGNSENANGFSTDEPTLRSLNATGLAKRIIELVLKVSALDKLNGTYYTGLPKLIEEMDWEPNKLHGSYNQCVTRTGRISSAKPNLQNLAPQLKPLIYSAYQP